MIDNVLRAGFGIAYGLLSFDSASSSYMPHDRLPSTYGTANDCRIAMKTHDPATLWQGRFAGRIVGSRPNLRQVSRVACFETEGECRAWLGFWLGKVNGTIIQSSCRLGAR